MKWILRIGLALAGLWAVAWFFAAQALRQGAEDWFAGQEAQGLVAENAGIAVRGFAYRFDLTVDQPHLAGTGWDWQAPFAQVFAMAWKPWHVIAVAPGGQRLTLGDQVLTLDTPKIEASLRMAPQADLPPREARVEWESLGVTSSQGWTLSTAHLLAAAVQAEDQALKLWLQVDDLTLPEGSDPGGLGRQVSNLRLDARLPLDAALAWDIEPVMQGLELKTLDLTWGKLDLEGAGVLSSDPNGQAQGTVTLRIKGWQALPDVAIDLGLIQPGLRGGIMGALEGMSQAGEDPAELVLPLVLQDGRMSLGPIPLGPAPYLQ
jgi:hypothetical protein